MEAPPEIKNMSIGVLSPTTKKELSLLLNDTSETLVEGRVMDYRGLAELYGKGFQFIYELEEKRDPMAALLASLAGKDTLLSTLWENLGHLGRTDVQSRCRGFFCQDVLAWQHRRPRNRTEAEQMKNEQKRSQIQAFFKEPSRDQSEAAEQRDQGNQRTVASSSTGLNHVSRSNEVKISTVQKSGSRPVNQKILSTDDDGATCAMYDAYINCAEEDIVLAKTMLSVLESTPYNLRLFLPQRQLMPGGCRFEDIADILKDRCQGKVVIILTRNYLDSEACHFVTNFCRAIDPGAREKQIIPVLYEDIGEAPRILTGLQFISKQRDEKRGWFWKRLMDAIKHNQR